MSAPVISYVAAAVCIGGVIMLWAMNVALRKTFDRYKIEVAKQKYELETERNTWQTMFYKEESRATELEKTIKTSGVEYYREQNDRLLNEIHSLKRTHMWYHYHSREYSTGVLSKVHNKMLGLENELEQERRKNQFLQDAIQQYSNNVSPNDGVLFALLTKALKVEKGDV